MNSLINIIEKNEKIISQENEKKQEIMINLIKRLYLDLDIYSNTLIYIWIDANRVKINMDGAKSLFGIKKNTKYDIDPLHDITSSDFSDYLEKSVKKFLAIRGIEIYDFYFNVKSVIFRIKSFKKMDLEKCLY